MVNHALAAIGQRHSIHDWEVADAAALAALTPTADDIGKVAWQQDDDSLWFLTDDSGPTWEQMNGGGGGAVSSVNGQTGVVVLDPDDLDDTSTTNKFASAAELTKLGGIETAADVTDAANVAAAGAVMESDTSIASMGFVLDEDAMTSDSATKLATQQSIKAYVDGQIAGAGSGDVTGPASSVDGEIALFDSTTGKILKRASTTGILKGTSGVIGAATAGSDYYAPGGTDVPVADGGTGASTAGAARTNLGLVIGTDVQAHDADLDVIAGLVDPNADRILFWDDSAGSYAYLTAGSGLTISGTTLSAGGGGNAAFQWTLDEGGVPATNYKGWIVVPFNCTIIENYVLADQTGDIVIDVWKDSYANFPPTVADSITASAKPTLTSAVKYHDTTLTGWTTSLTAGDVLTIKVDSAATLTLVTFVLIVSR